MGSPRSYDLTTRERLEAMGRYRVAGLVASLVCAFFLFAALWIVNGFTTSWAMVSLSRRMLDLGNRVVHGVPMVFSKGMLATLWVVGAIVHFTVSSIEQHLWRLGDRRFYPLILVVGFADVLTAALAIRVFALSLRMNPGFLFNVASTALAVVIAILPEVMMALVLAALRSLGRYRRV